MRRIERDTPSLYSWYHEGRGPRTNVTTYVAHKGAQAISTALSIRDPVSGGYPGAGLAKAGDAIVHKATQVGDAVKWAAKSAVGLKSGARAGSIPVRREIAGVMRAPYYDIVTKPFDRKLLTEVPTNWEPRWWQTRSQISKAGQAVRKLPASVTDVDVSKALRATSGDLAKAKFFAPLGQVHTTAYPDVVLEGVKKTAQAVKGASKAPALLSKADDVLSDVIRGSSKHVGKAGGFAKAAGKHIGLLGVAAELNPLQEGGVDGWGAAAEVADLAMWSNPVTAGLNLGVMGLTTGYALATGNWDWMGRGLFSAVEYGVSGD